MTIIGCARFTCWLLTSSCLVFSKLITILNESGLDLHRRVAQLEMPMLSVLLCWMCAVECAELAHDVFWLVLDVCWWFWMHVAGFGCVLLVLLLLLLRRSTSVVIF